ncbi:MAG: hypothetical protein FWC33_02545 [Candidatus Bathyarchaeota archaeon]|nr:hypothetical protein [Candidatus Termiticorpusculum sp.]
MPKTLYKCTECSVEFFVPQRIHNADNTEIFNVCPSCCCKKLVNKKIFAAWEKELLEKLRVHKEPCFDEKVLEIIGQYYTVAKVCMTCKHEEDWQTGHNKCSRCHNNCDDYSECFWEEAEPLPVEEAKA